MRVPARCSSATSPAAQDLVEQAPRFDESTWKAVSRIGPRSCSCGSSSLRAEARRGKLSIPTRRLGYGRCPYRRANHSDKHRAPGQRLLSVAAVIRAQW